MTDAEILHGLRSDRQEEDRCLKYLYWEYFPMVRGLISRLGGSESEAEDIFQEGLITFYEHVIQRKYQETSSIKTYLYSICRNIWMNHLKRKQVAKKYTDQKVTPKAEDQDPASILLEKEKNREIMRVMNQLGEQCREILRYRLYEKLSMEEISVKMGFKNEQNARNKHYKCKQSLKAIIKADPIIKSIIPFIK